MAKEFTKFNKVVYGSIRPTRRRRLRGLLGSVLVIVLAGCASLPRLEVDDADFVVGGRLAVRDDVQSFSASFTWMQRDADYAIELWGPFGAGRVRVRGNERRVTISDARGDLVRGVDPDVLMRRQLGWSLPVDALAYWIRGAVAPIHDVVEVSRSADRLDAFEQDGWLIEFDRFRTFEGVERPARIVASKQPSRIVVAVRSWQSRTDGVADGSE